MKKVIRLTESDLIKIVKKVISESEESSPDISPANGCTTMKICQGKTFKANYMDRMWDLYSFMFGVNLTTRHNFKLVKHGQELYEPAPAPTNSPFPFGAKVAWEYKNPNDPYYKINVYQRNECIKSCPIIQVSYLGNFDMYLLLDDADYNRLKSDVKKYHSEAMKEGGY